MKIVHIVPGSGGTFYCENCLRDGALVQALRRMGHDVIMMPLYLPLCLDAPDTLQDTPVFFGGINVYLQQRFSFFRKTPRWLDRLLDARWLLKQAAAREGSTNAADLGPMTISMLHGRDGRQRKEIDRLLEWLVEHERPDAVHISNALLTGLARPIKEALGCAVFCTLQDEDTWVEAMHPDDAAACWGAMAENGAYIDAYAAVSRWYADKMMDRLHVPEEKMRVVPLGIEIEGMTPAPEAPEPPVIGFLSRMSEGQGLGLLVDAFIALRKKPEWASLQLKATGGITPVDEAFVDAQRAKLARHGLDQEVHFLSDFQREKRLEFLRSLTLLSVPATKGEAFGGFILEALAHAVPVVQPDAGAFSEVIEALSGGVTYDSSAPGALVAAIEELLLDGARRRAFGEAGRKRVVEHFSIERMAADMAALYAEHVETRATP